METLVNNINRETYRRWSVILEVERFISNYGNERFETRRKYYKNYYCQLARLFDSDQLLILRGLENEIIGVCGWIRVKQNDEWKINKITWTLPEEILNGENLYISFCVLKGKNMWSIRKKIKEIYDKKINEVFWFDISKSKYIRIKNILKEN